MGVTFDLRRSICFVESQNCDKEHSLGINRIEFVLSWINATTRLPDKSRLLV
jgi:hypothetical protein